VHLPLGEKLEAIVGRRVEVHLAEGSAGGLGIVNDGADLGSRQPAVRREVMAAHEDVPLAEGLGVVGGRLHRVERAVEELSVARRLRARASGGELDDPPVGAVLHGHAARGQVEALDQARRNDVGERLPAPYITGIPSMT